MGCYSQLKRSHIIFLLMKKLSPLHSYLNINLVHTRLLMIQKQIFCV